MSSEEVPTTNDAGVTLLELLVGLALMATIAVTMAAAIAQLRPMQAFQQRLDDRATASAIADVIARDVEAALPIPLIVGGSVSSAVLKGERRKIVFTAVVPIGFERRGLREVTYELLTVNGGDQLLRTVRPRRFAENQEAGLQIDTLFDGPVNLRLSYLLRTEQGGREWRDEFRDINVLPRAVSISISSVHMPQGEARRVVTFATD